ncbi:MAG: Gfo/Idh/MocA family oxidoreductase, partial [Dehalococcoidia bacterium]
MSVQRVRIGIVGAGRNVWERHIPGFREIEGVELVSVCNRSRESSERSAAEFGIPTVYDNWLELVEADDTDAICIGTWPYMHCAMTLASFENDKHVLTEARMSMNALEAHAMLEASRAAPHLVAQIVPSPRTLRADRTVHEMIAGGYLGDILAVEMRATRSSFADPEGPMHWRHDRDMSGYNIMDMGIYYEALMRWIGPASEVMAMTKTVVKQRKDAQGVLRAVSVPDHVDILCKMVCGAQAHIRFS